LPAYLGQGGRLGKIFSAEETGGNAAANIAEMLPLPTLKGARPLSESAIIACSGPFTTIP
jgi:hypothetical protein